MINIQSFAGFSTSQVVQDFGHQQFFFLPFFLKQLFAQEVIKLKVIQQNLQHGEFFPWETFSAAQALRSLEIFDVKQTSIQQASKD